MTKTAILEMILKLAGFEKIKIELDRLESGVEYQGSGERKVGDETEFIEFQAIGFECALGDLLGILYDTVDVDFAGNAAILFE
ncbi:hypothetical protein EGI16_21775 [Chryseobacterium sp. G0240]|uniref:hypothetical protein n=1 Tax=Chryseobacterium sp. G0240 TaxID=2487066 RepID=UPI000F4528D8|nr:hypothetical protein [Chryseobacterium sp. G0240]ROH98310.1 hypothetical protein EGI16_21775 [Chryseobacterium sp. G0240]